MNTTGPCPARKGINTKKIAYVKRFAPLGLVIGTGEYFEDLDADIKEEVLDRIEAVRFGKDGYVFAGQYDGLSLSGPAKGKNMLEVTDSQGVKIVRELIKNARAGGGFVALCDAGPGGQEVRAQTQLCRRARRVAMVCRVGDLCR